MRSLPALLVLACLALLSTGCGPQAKKAKFLKQADAAFAAGQYDAAEIEYRNAQRIEPLNPHAIAQLGLLYLEQGRQIRAYSYLVKAAELSPGNLDVKLKLATLNAAGRKFPEARAAALAVLEKRPQDPAAPLLLAEVSLQPKEIAETRERLQSLPAPAPTGAPVLVALGLLDLRQNKVTEAEAAFNRAIKQDPKFADAHSALALIYLRQKDMTKAEAAFKAAADVAPVRSSKRIQYAQFKIQSKDPAAGRQILEDLTKQVPDYLPAWMALAELATAEGKPDEGLVLVAKVLARESSHPEALMLSGRLRLAKGETDKAVAEMERMVGTFSTMPQVHFQLAQAYMAKGDMNKAAAALNQAVTLAPNFAEAVIAQASLNVRKGDLVPAVASLKKLVAQRPDLLAARSLLADALRLQGKLDDALAVYDAVEKAFPRIPTTSLFRGLILARQNKLGEARQAFERAVELAPTYIAAVEQLVALDLAEKKPDAARTRAEALIAKTPKSANGYLLLSRVMLSQKDEMMAELALQKAIAVQPDSPVAYHLLAQLQVSHQEPAKALANLEALIAKNPKDAQALMLMSVIHEQKKDFAAARDAYEKLVAVNPKFGPAFNNLAVLYSERFDQLDRAFEMAQKARDLLPQDPNVADTLGWILYKKGQFTQAETLLQESAEKAATIADVQYHLGMTQYMLGEEAAAKAALQRALELDAKVTGADEAKRRLALLELDPAKSGPDARSSLEKTVAERKNDPIALSRLAAIYERDHLPDKALATYEAALAASPSNVSVMLGLIRLLSARQETARAFELAKAARKLAANDVDVAHLLGRLAAQSGQQSWGLSLLQEAGRKEPNNPAILFDTAEAAFAVGKADDTGDNLRKALEINPLFAQASRARHILAMMELAAKPSDPSAAGKVDTALKATPNDAPALMALGAIQEFKRDPAGATKTYEKVLGLCPDQVVAKTRLAILYAPAKDTDLKKALEFATKAREAFPDDSELAKALGIIVYRQGNFSRAGSLLQEAARKRDTDPEVFYYLGLARQKLDNRAEAKKALQRALDLKLADEQAAEARKVIATLK